MSYFISFFQRWEASPEDKDLQPGGVGALSADQRRKLDICYSFIFYFLSFVLTTMALLYFLLGAAAVGFTTSVGAAAAAAPSSANTIPGTSEYVAPYGFPTSAFSRYYFLPATPTQEPQPALYDPVLNKTYPANLTNPNTIPDVDPDPVYFPNPTLSLTGAAATSFLSAVVKNVTTVISAGECGVLV